MDQKAWLEYELRTAVADYAPDQWEEIAYLNGYRDALTNALNNLGGMTPNTPDLASGYLPSEIKNQTLTPNTLRDLANALEREEITGINVALALDLLTGGCRHPETRNLDCDSCESCQEVICVTCGETVTE